MTATSVSLQNPATQGRHETHLDLPLHGDAKERDEVHDEDGPEDGDVEEIEEGANEGDGGGLRR